MDPMTAAAIITGTAVAGLVAIKLIDRNSARREKDLAAPFKPPHYADQRGTVAGGDIVGRDLIRPKVVELPPTVAKTVTRTYDSVPVKPAPPRPPINQFGVGTPGSPSNPLHAGAVRHDSAQPDIITPVIVTTLLMDQATRDYTPAPSPSYDPPASSSSYDSGSSSSYDSGSSSSYSGE
jgi:hypothetical protein